MTRKTKYILMGLLLILLFVPVHQVHAARATGTVKNRVLNVRSSASTSSGIVCKLSQGTKVTIISETTGTDNMKWYDVYFAYNGGTEEGYVRADLLNVSGTVTNSTAADTPAVSSDSGTLYVDRTSVRVREKATTGSTIVAGLEKGAEVKVQGTTTGSDGKQWTKVSFTKDGKSVQGYIRSDLLTSTKTSGTNGSSSSSDDSEYLYVNVGAVHVRDKASASSASLTTLEKGSKVKKKSEKKGSDGRQWTKVSFTKNEEKIHGYIRSDFLSGTKTSDSTKTTTAAADTKTKTKTVRPAVVNVRSSASTSGSISAKLTQGSKVSILSEKTGSDGKKWYQISCTYGRITVTGYIRADLLN